MRGGAQVKEALGFVTLLWNHPILTGLLLLIFTPPFFPLVVYFSPLLMSTALCVVALVSVGSQMEKIKAEGGPGQLENHFGREHGISRWVPRDSNESMERRHYGHRESHRNRYARSGININVVPPPSSWTAGDGGRELATIRATPQLRPEPVETHPTTPPAEESDEDWWDMWVKEYESRPGWGEQEDQALPTPAIRTSTISQPVAQAPTPPTIPTPVTARRDRHQDAPPMTSHKPIRQEARQEEKPPPAAVTAPVARSVAVSVAAPVAASVAAPVSIPLVHRQEAARFLPPPTSTSRSSQDEVVVAVRESDLRPHISLAPIRTGREKRDVRQVMNRVFSKPAAQTSELPPPRSVDVERVSDLQALQSIEKLLHMEMGRFNTATPPVSVARNFASVADMKNAEQGNSSGTRPQVGVARGAMSSQLNVAKGSGSASVMSTGKGIAVEASEKNRNKIAVAAPTPEDVAGETPLLRHLKTSRSEKQARSSVYSPLPARTSRSLMSEKVLPPPQFSPRLLQSLQPLPPKGFSPRLPNLTSAPLGNPVEKIPQWVYDGMPRNRAERAESQAHVKQGEKSEEKHVRAFEQVYYTRRTHARRPLPVQADPTTLQGRLDVSMPSTPSLTPAEVTPVSTQEETTSEQMITSRVSLHRPASRASSPRRAPAAVVAEIVHTRISDVAVEVAHAADYLHESSSLDSTEMSSAPVPTPRAFSPRTSPSAMAAGSPRRASVAASPRAASPQPASIAASLRPASVASSPQKASVAASPRRASRASSPQKLSIVSAAPWPASVASSPHKLAPVGACPQRASVASSPQRASIAASPRPPSRAPPAASSPHRSSVPSSPSMPHSRRRRQSFKHCTDKVAFARIEGSTYYDPPSAAEKEINVVAEEPPAEEYVPIEEDLPTEEIVNSQTLTPRAREPIPPDPSPEDDAALHWGRSYSETRKSRRRLEPRRVVTSQDSDMFSLKKSFSTRNGETKKFVDSSSDDERESVTPRASRRSMGRTIKPLVWRSRSVQAHEPEDSD